MIAAVLTTRNEAPTIGYLVRQLHSKVDRVLVVDENSTDRTRDHAACAGATVIQWEGGIGPCLMHGWLEAIDRGAERIVQLDAGGSHDPRAITGMLWSHHPIVIGSRFVQGATHEGRWRAHASRAYSRLWAWKTGRDIKDWTSGFRVFSAEAAEKLAHDDYDASMHAWQAEVLARAISLGLSITEVPIRYRTSESSLSWKVAFEAGRVWWRC